MSWNRYNEMRKFKEKQKLLAEAYRAAGMSEKDIEEILEYDRKAFLKDINYEMHKTDLECYAEGMCEEGRNMMGLRYPEQLTVKLKLDHSKRQSWVDELDSEWLICGVKKLSAEEREIADDLYRGYTQKEIVKLMSEISERAMSRRVCGIRNKLNGCRPGGNDNEN